MIHNINYCSVISPLVCRNTYSNIFSTMADPKNSKLEKLQCIIIMIKCYLTIDHNCVTQAILFLESIQMGKFSDSVACDALHMSIHTCLEQTFGFFLKPPNNIYVILILGKNAAI